MEKAVFSFFPLIYLIKTVLPGLRPSRMIQQKEITKLWAKSMAVNGKHLTDSMNISVLNIINAFNIQLKLSYLFNTSQINPSLVLLTSLYWLKCIILPLRDSIVGFFFFFLNISIKRRENHFSMTELKMLHVSYCISVRSCSHHLAMKHPKLVKAKWAAVYLAVCKEPFFHQWVFI